MENAFIESLNGRLRDECLNVEIFEDLSAAREQIESWRIDYNDRRPHSALGDRTPNEFRRAAAKALSKETRPAEGPERDRPCRVKDPLTAAPSGPSLPRHVRPLGIRGGGPCPWRFRPPNDRV